MMTKRIPSDFVFMYGCFDNVEGKKGKRKGKGIISNKGVNFEGYVIELLKLKILKLSN